MFYSSQIKRKASAGFTLVEILIIAPIVVLAISGFIALMVTTVGEVLSTRDQSTIAYETQSALDRIEQDTRLSTQFLQTTNVQTAPQGSDGNYTGTAAFSNTPNRLLLSELATDQNPNSPTRWLIYFANQPNPCGANQKYNRPFLTKVVYFINNGSLWRRTILPTYNTNPPATADNNTVCSTPWQKNSCSPGYSAGICQTNDEEIMKNIDSLNVQYYSDPSSSTDLGAGAALTASTINASITAKKTTAGKNLVNTGSVRVTKLNSIDTTQLPPAAPVVSHTSVTPENIEFAWPAVSSATSYQIGYMINSGQWVSQTLDAGTTKFAVTASRNDVISFRVAAFNGAGSSAYGTDSATIPAWSTFSLQNSWVNYAGGYNTAEFTKTSASRVFLKGLVKNGTATSGTVIANLPVGYRPLGRLVFQVATSPNSAARIDVDSNGDVIIYTGVNAWISLDTISFLPSSMPYSWSTMPFYNSWSNWGLGYEDVHATIDNIGRVNLQGLAKAGVTTTNTAIARTNDISSTYLPTKTLHFPAGGNGFSEFWIWYNDGEVTKRGAQTSSYMGLQALWYPTTIGTWSTPTFQNSWVNYGTPYPNLQYTKAADGVVTIRGLIKSGTATNGTVIANLPSGFRPPATELLTIASNDDFGRVDISSGGDIIFRAGSNAWYAINVSYIAN